MFFFVCSFSLHFLDWNFIWKVKWYTCYSIQWSFHRVKLLYCLLYFRNEFIHSKGCNKGFSGKRALILSIGKCILMYWNIIYTQWKSTMDVLNFFLNINHSWNNSIITILFQVKSHYFRMEFHSKKCREFMFYLI